MPDANKLAVMDASNYVVAKSCWTCVHATGLDSRDSWGTCRLKENQYHHEKHGRFMQAPAHPSLCCKYWETSDMTEIYLGSYWPVVGKIDELQVDLDEAVKLLAEWLRRYDDEAPGSWENYILKHSTKYISRTRALVAKRGQQP